MFAFYSFNISTEINRFWLLGGVSQTNEDLQDRIEVGRYQQRHCRDCEIAMISEKLGELPLLSFGLMLSVCLSMCLSLLSVHTSVQLI